MDDLQHIDTNPCALLGRWLDTAQRDSGLTNWNSMYLATVDDDGRPSVRTVLHKGYDTETGVLRFYTNYRSRKARELEGNRHVAAVMHWDRLERQVRIEGVVATLSDEESDAYFASRSRISQIGAWASDQSDPLDAQRRLRLRVAAAALRFAGRAVARPAHWGGYSITPHRMEFWRGMPGRIHRRVLFQRDEAAASGWSGEWLFP